MLPKGAKVVDSPSPGSKVYYRVSNWPVDIKAAWELVEEMYNYNIKKIGGVTTAVLYPDTHILHGQVGKADTAPLAICHAFIQWKESQK
jgi:hypothetical protein